MSNDIMIIYFDEKDCKLYVETDERVYELEVGADITEEAPFKVAGMEILKVHDPTDVEEDDPVEKQLTITG